MATAKNPKTAAPIVVTLATRTLQGREYPNAIPELTCKCGGFAYLSPAYPSLPFVDRLAELHTFECSMPAAFTRKVKRAVLAEPAAPAAPASEAKPLDAAAATLLDALNEWQRTNLVNTWLHGQHPEWGPMGRLDRRVETALIKHGALVYGDKGLTCTEIGAYVAERLRTAQLAAAKR